MILSRLFAALAVVALIACAFLWMGRTAADARADAAESRAQALQGELSAAKRAIAGEQVSADATSTARQSADERQIQRDTRQARVETYARNAVDPCTADPDLMRELAAGEADFRAATDRLRGYGHASGQGAQPAK